MENRLCSLIKRKLEDEFHKIRFSMTHFHYDRFDTPDDEQDGRRFGPFRVGVPLVYTPWAPRHAFTPAGLPRWEPRLAHGY
jgi:hypothetical protein